MPSFNVLIGVTGSVASIKLPKLISQLETKCKERGIEICVRVVTTERAMHFYDVDEVRALVDRLYRDEDEWTAWQRIGDDVLHIELRKWAHLGVIAPIDANTSAKIANGVCDNLLTSLVRAWDLAKPLYFAPAMNVHMWQHPITAEVNAKLRSFAYVEIPPISKRLACGDVGVGAMAEVAAIADIVCDKLVMLSQS